MLELEGRINFQKYKGTVTPICLPEAPRKYYGKQVTVAGWGLLWEDGKQAKKLMEVDLTVIWMKQCRKDFGYAKKDITSNMLCTYALVRVIQLTLFCYIERLPNKHRIM